MDKIPHILDFFDKSLTDRISANNWVVGTRFGSSDLMIFIDTNDEFYLLSFTNFCNMVNNNTKVKFDNFKML